MYYKLKIKDDKIIVVDIVETKKDYDTNYLYATADEMSKVNPDILVDAHNILGH